jgi:hypothetical protein
MGLTKRVVPGAVEILHLMLMHAHEVASALKTWGRQLKRLPDRNLCAHYNSGSELVELHSLKLSSQLL